MHMLILCAKFVETFMLSVLITALLKRQLAKMEVNVTKNSIPDCKPYSDRHNTFESHYNTGFSKIQWMSH